MKCTFCGFEFREEDSQVSCVKCPLAKGCSLIRCPNCGFELAPDPKWFKNLKDKRRKKDEPNR